MSNTQKALTYGLGALAIGGAARHTYKNLKHKQQAAPIPPLYLPHISPTSRLHLP